VLQQAPHPARQVAFPRREAVPRLSVAPLGMTTSRSQPTGDRCLPDGHETGSGPHTTACIEMIETILCGGLWELGSAQGMPAALGALLSARTTCQIAPSGS